MNPVEGIQSQVFNPEDVFDKSIFKDKKAKRLLIKAEGQNDVPHMVAIKTFEDLKKGVGENPPKLSWLESKRFIPLKITITEEGTTHNIWVKVNKRSLQKRLGYTEKDIKQANLSLSALSTNKELKPTDIENEEISTSKNAQAKVSECLEKFIELIVKTEKPKMSSKKLEKIKTNIDDRGGFILKEEVDYIHKMIESFYKKVDKSPKTNLGGDYESNDFIPAHNSIKDIKEVFDAEKEKLPEYLIT